MSLEDPYVAPVADHLGHLELHLNDRDGTPGGMSGQGDVRLVTANGTVIELRRGNPSDFMPAAWKVKVKQVLDELRAEVATKLGVSGS